MHSRVLLHRQDELAELEKHLIALDEEDLELEPLALQSRRRDDQRIEQPSRKSVIDKIDTKLKDYGRFAMSARHGHSPDVVSRRTSDAYEVDGSGPAPLGAKLRKLLQLDGQRKASVSRRTQVRQSMSPSLQYSGQIGPGHRALQLTASESLHWDEAKYVS